MFDAGSILILASKLGEKVVDVMKENVTTSLAYYELGNAIWKECNLAKRLTVDEAVEVLKFVFSLLDLMQIIHIREADLSVKTLYNASKSNITYYDAAYLTVAQEIGKVLVSDDENLIATSKKLGIQTKPSKIFANK